MACYKRKGYKYVSGHYEKPNFPLVGEVSASDSSTVAPVPPKESPTIHTGTPESPNRSADKISMAGIAENAIGSSLVSTAKYLIHYMPMMVLIRELHEVLVAQPRRILQQQTKGMGIGMQPMSFPSSPPPSQPLNTKRLGIDTNPFNGGMMMGT